MDLAFGCFMSNLPLGIKIRIARFHDTGIALLLRHRVYNFARFSTTHFGTHFQTINDRPSGLEAGQPPFFLSQLAFL